MLQPKTHFEQIPLGAVRRIVEEQIRRKNTAEAARCEGFPVMAGDANELSGRPVAFDVALLPWLLRPERLRDPKRT